MSPKAGEQTRGQLERTLSQRIQALYRDKLDRQPSKVTCQLFECKLAIIVEDSVTQPERILVEVGQIDLAEQVRSILDSAIAPDLKNIIREVLGVSVIDLLSDATLGTGRTGAIAVLESTPNVRNPNSIPKTKVSS